MNRFLTTMHPHALKPSTAGIGRPGLRRAAVRNVPEAAPRAAPARRSRGPRATSLAIAGALLLSLAPGARADRSRTRVHAVDHAPAESGVPGTMRIRIQGTQEPTFTVYKLDYPARVVVDIAGAELDRKLTSGSETKATWPVNGWSVGQVSVYELHDVAGDGVSQGSQQSLVRVVVGMARPGTYRAEAKGRDVLVTVTPQEPAPAGASGADAAGASRAVAQAEARRRKVMAEVQAAEQQKTEIEAERRRIQAELGRAREARAEAERAAAEAERMAEQARALRAREEAAYREVSTARAEAERMTEQARALRAREEAAYRKVSTARAEATQHAAAINQADQRLSELQRAVDTARAEATAMRRAASEAERRAAALDQRKDATQREIERARGEARRLAKARTEAEAALEARRREVAGQEREVTRLAKARAEAETALQTLSKAAAEARAARQSEEKRVAELSQRRQRLEAELDQARKAVRVAQAEWKAQRTEAERELRELRASADKARARRLREEANIAELTERRKALESQSDRIRSQTGAQSESKRRAELRELDAAAAKAKQARQAEEARLAELAKRRKALEAELARAHRQAQAAAQAERRAQQSEVEAERRVLHAAAAQARQAKDEEAARIAELSQRRKALEKEIEAMHAQARAATAAKTEAEAELRELDTAAAKAKQARQAEEARLAALQRRGKTQASEPAASGRGKASARVARVEDVDFVDQQGVARVVIALSSDARPRIVSAEGKRAVLEIDGVELPTKLQRTLDTSAYHGPIRAVSSYRDREDGDKMRLVVDLAYPAKHALKRKGGTYYWDFAKSEARERQATRARSPRRRRGARAQSIPAPVIGGYGASSAPITQKTVAQLARQRRKVYRGTKIDLDLKDVDIHNVMRLLADVGGINIVVPDEVQARVTVRLRQVPWDQALEVVLASKDLWYRREGNLYRIATRKQLDAEAQAEAERLAAMVKAEAPEPQIFTLNYAVADELRAQLEALLSPKGRIEIDPRTNSLIINDIRAHRRRIIELLTRLDTQTPQIQIEARIVEARSTFTREFGVQWGGSFRDANTGLIFPSGVSVVGGAVDGQTVSTGVDALSPDFAVNLPAAVGTGSGGALGFAFGSLGGLDINLRLSALEDTGSVRIISAPKITVLNNVRAEINQGQSIPISVISANGVQTQFVQADLSLKVTPHVSQRDCSIAMELEVEKNEADFVNTGARGDPTILRKEARTTVLVADNETTVIGGIYTRNSGLSYSKVPFLGDLPLLGWLFKNRQENDERTEVLVFITPRITNKAFLRCE